MVNVREFDSVDELRKNGFDGFLTIDALWDNFERISPAKGVYLVLFPLGKKPTFTEKSTGGRFKGKDPNVPIENLKDSWVYNTTVLYVGQTKSKRGLKGRIRDYLMFGKGEPIGHRGGRYIWQIKDKGDLMICWKALPDVDPRGVEKGLISAFEKKYDKLPFANLQR